MLFSHAVAVIGGLLGMAALGEATNLHANKGCIIVGGYLEYEESVPICAPEGTTVENGNTVIYARFSGDSQNQYDTAGCVLYASWPASYGDIFFGADNCLYDARGNNIDGQCCTLGVETLPNPYWYQAHGKLGDSISPAPPSPSSTGPAVLPTTI